MSYTVFFVHVWRGCLIYKGFMGAPLRGARDAQQLIAAALEFVGDGLDGAGVASRFEVGEAVREVGGGRAVQGE